MNVIKLTKEQFKVFESGNVIESGDEKKYYNFPYWVMPLSNDRYEAFLPVELPISRRVTYASGLKPNKYVISKQNGDPIDPNAFYFVLRLDTDPHARKAAMAYAESVENENPELAKDLKTRLCLYEPTLKLSND